MANVLLKKWWILTLLGLLVLGGCSKQKSTVMPSDNRTISPVNNGSFNSYSGVAVDGYLRHALVWLDVNGDKKVTYCARDASGAKTDPNCADEPTAITGVGGQFTLDLTQLQKTYLSQQKKMLDPKQYPLMLLAIPGVTIDEDNIAGGNSNLGIITKGYFLMAPSGDQVISPFSTLVKIERDRLVALSKALQASSSTGSTATTTTTAALKKTAQEWTNQAVNSVRARMGSQVNITEDYLKNKNNKIHAYAKALVKQIQSLVPSSYNQQLKNTTLDNLKKGQGNPFIVDNILVIGRAVLSGMKDTFKTVDASVTNPLDDSLYKWVNVSGLTLPVLAAKINNPMVLVKSTTSQNLKSVPGKSLSLISFSGTGTSAVKTYTYNANGDNTSIDIDGYGDVFNLAAQALTPVDGKTDSTMIQTFDSTNQLKTKESKVFSYDANGTKSTTSDQTQQYNYNSKGVLQSIVDSSAGGKTQLYSYNSAGKLQSVLTMLTSDKSNISKIDYTYDTANPGNYSTVESSYSGGAWVSDPQSLIKYIMEPVPNSTTGQQRLKAVLLQKKFINETGLTYYRWDYTYCSSTAKCSAGVPVGFLEKKSLMTTDSAGNPFNTSTPTNVVIEKMEYKHLADLVYQ